MYQRFLNNHDYIGIITEEALDQLIRGDEDRLAQAEEAGEQSIVEYLTTNYEIERELMIGKNLLPYNPQITYPAGAHFYDDKGRIVQSLKTINGIKAPEEHPYWEEYIEPLGEETKVKQYSQRLNYEPDEIVRFGTNNYYKCLDYNGPDFNNIRIPGVNAWARVDAEVWEANVLYAQWDVVYFDGQYFALLAEDSDYDLTIDPMNSDDWGLIGEYQEDYTYELNSHEYVVYHNHVYYPVINPNADEVVMNESVKLHDPRNPNIKKHLLRLALYELYKLVSPTNVSTPRIADYQTSIVWLRDASKLRLNPGIPRRLACDKKPVTDFAIASYIRNYDPYENMWHF